jgi:murein DD-endopeptidase MepM/ murein hydrolase activator NlpD
MSLRSFTAAVAAVVPLVAAPGGLAAPPTSRSTPPTGWSAPRSAHPPGQTWVLPLPGEPMVVHGFDPPAQRWSAGHRGVDLAAADGAAVRAAGAGVVGYAGLVAGVPVVTVVHGELRTTYQPVRATVRPGQAVTAGARLGRLRLPGGHCAPTACLHWGLLRATTYLDPMTLLGRGPPVLLPLLD